MDYGYFKMYTYFVYFEFDVNFVIKTMRFLVNFVFDSFWMMALIVDVDDKELGKNL